MEVVHVQPRTRVRFGGPLARPQHLQDACSAPRAAAIGSGCRSGSDVQDVADVGVSAVGGDEVVAAFDERLELGFQCHEWALTILDFSEFGLE